MSAALAVTILLAACRSGSKETLVSSPVLSVPSVEDEWITILFAVDDSEQPFYKDLIKAFEEANPGLQVRLVSIQEIVSSDWDSGWQRLASAADVINMDAYPHVVQQGLVRDLSPLIKADPTFDSKDFYPGALESYQWDGSTWALPTRVGFDVIFVDRDAFDSDVA